ASDEHDLFFLQGWVHAQDRLFQMDVTRRRASGTLAELLGTGALGGDVQLRTFGLRRAAESALPLVSGRARDALDAYAEGVNAYVAGHPLPPEYAALELTHFAPWTVVDSLAVGKLIAFGLSFDLDDIARTTALVSYQTAGAAAGFDGTKLFFQDLFRSAPFDPASTIPDALRAAPRGGGERRFEAAAVHPRVMELAGRFLEQVRGEPFLRRMLDRDDRDGSNQWAISGKHTASGYPLLASDPHLALGAPSTFYPIHLMGPALDAIGNSFAGSPFVIVGHNRHVAWGATVNPLDVTDVFQEQIVTDATSPSGLSTIYKGAKEWVIPIPETYRANVIGDGRLDVLVTVPAGGPIPAATLIVPRRNQGPLVQVDVAHGIGLSVQYTGFSATRELETFLGFDTAHGIDDIRKALQFFDVGSQNFICADVAGNIGYFTGSEVPVREDLQAGAVAGLPPYFIRNGTGGNEWLPVRHPQPAQAIPYEILPPEEMPHLVNPPAGFLINANNDPVGITLGNDPLSRMRPGGGIYYLNPGFDFGNRAGRITRRVHERLASGRMSFRD
ncbi:MAG TPA: penicillin acylase family protein, partial [Thermoanaerobaculia bacterium]